MRLDGTDGERWNEHASKNGQSCGSIIIVERCGRCRTMTMRFRTTYTHIQSSLSLSSTSDNNVERRTTASLVTDAHGSAKLPFSCVSSAPLNIYIYVYISLFPLSSCFSRGVDRGRELDPIAQRSGFLERQWRCCWSVCKRREKRNALICASLFLIEIERVIRETSPWKYDSALTIIFKKLPTQDNVLERTVAAPSFHLPLTLDLQSTIVKLFVDTILKRGYYYTKKKGKRDL